MLNYHDIRWFHSIDLGNGLIIQGQKSAEQLASEFEALGLTEGFLRGRRLLDIGCCDGYFSLHCARLGAEVTAIDGIHRDSLRYVREHADAKFQFYCIDFLSPSFFELGRFDVILYLGVLYHTMYPFEHFQRLTTASAIGATVLIESAFYNVPGHEDAATLFFDYDRKLTPDSSSVCFPSVNWITVTLSRIGFDEINLLAHSGGDRGRVILRARYADDRRSPHLYAFEQI